MKEDDDKVTTLSTITSLDLHPDKVLEAAIGKLSDVVILGYDKEGDEYFASSMGDNQESLWIAERFKKMLMED